MEKYNNRCMSGANVQGMRNHTGFITNLHSMMVTILCGYLSQNVIQTESDLLHRLGVCTYICEPHLFFVIHSIHPKATLVDEGIQARVLLCQEFFCVGHAEMNVKSGGHWSATTKDMLDDTRRVLLVFPWVVVTGMGRLYSGLGLDWELHHRRCFQGGNMVYLMAASSG